MGYATTGITKDGRLTVSGVPFVQVAGGNVTLDQAVHTVDGEVPGGDAIVMRGTVRTAKELIPEEAYGVDALVALENGLPNYGVMPWRQTTCKRACREGWAPQPTNLFKTELDTKRGKWRAPKTFN